MMDQLTAFEKNARNRTGINLEEDKSVIVYPFDNYKIEVKLDPDGRFLGIIGIGLKKDFLSPMQKIRKIGSMGYLDLSQKYRKILTRVTLNK